MKTVKMKRITRAQLKKLVPGGLQTYLQRMWHADDGTHAILIMERSSGIMLEVHTMPEEDQPTFMLTTSGKRSRVSLHGLSDAVHALTNWIANTMMHGVILISWKDLQNTWNPTADDRAELLADLAFHMPLDEWQESWMQREGKQMADEVASMVMASACVQMLDRMKLLETEYQASLQMPERYGISMRHGQHGLLNNTLQKLLQEIKQLCNDGTNSQQAQQTTT